LGIGNNLKNGTDNDLKLPSIYWMYISNKMQKKWFRE
jgi:hypothetical protein